MCCFFHIVYWIVNPYHIDKFEGILKVLHQKISIIFTFWNITREWLISRNKVSLQKLFKIKFRFEWYLIWPYLMKFDFLPHGSGAQIGAWPYQGIGGSEEIAPGHFLNSTCLQSIHAKFQLSITICRFPIKITTLATRLL